MIARDVDSRFTLKRVQQMLGLSESTVAKLISAGFVSPGRGRRNEHLFSFQDLMLLRTAHALKQARIPPRKILMSLAKLKAELPAELPLTGLRITAMGSDVIVRERSLQWEATSGQLVLNFEVEQSAGSVSFIEPAAPSRDATEDWFRKGEALEATDRSAAEQAYRRAIEFEPLHVSAYLNLGALLCESERCAEAVQLYDGAATSIGHEPLMHFNHAIALEDQGRPVEALAAYERALTLDASLADAHYNAGILLQGLGDTKGALRHLSAYKRLER